MLRGISGLTFLVFAHVLQGRPGHSFHQGPVAGHGLQRDGVRFLTAFTTVNTPLWSVVVTRSCFRGTRISSPIRQVWDVVW